MFVKWISPGISPHAPLDRRLYIFQVVSDQAAVGFCGLRVRKEIHLVMSYPVKMTPSSHQRVSWNGAGLSL